MQLIVIQEQVIYSTEIAMILLIFLRQYFTSVLHNFFRHNLMYYTIFFRDVYVSSKLNLYNRGAIVCLLRNLISFNAVNSFM
jgi:hypothetical protein